MYDYRAVLRRVIDGDTIVVDLDLGFHVWTTIHVRLLGLDCPEKNTPEGRAARDFTTAWCAAHPDLVVTTAPAQPVSFERWVATVTSGRADLATDLRAAGFVK